jgi:hypothetical protein
MQRNLKIKEPFLFTARDVSFFQTIWTKSRAKLSSYSIGFGNYFPGDKATGEGGHYPPPSSDEVREK